jgi:hypothetical protein
VESAACVRGLDPDPEILDVAKVAQNNPQPLLDTLDIFADFRGDGEFAQCLGDAMRDLDRLGVKGALGRSLSSADATTVAG